jgi:hypothetical protein
MELKLSKKNKPQYVKSPTNKLHHDVKVAKQTAYFNRPPQYRMAAYFKL